MFDVDDFEAYLLSDRMLGDDTIRKRLGMLRALQDLHGLDAAAFVASEDDARQEIRRAMVSLRRSGVKGQGLGNYSRALTCLRDYAGHQLKVPYPKITDPEPRVYTASEWQALRAFRWPKDRDAERQIRAVMEFAYYTAMRPGEVCRASLQDLDEDKQRVYVRYPEKGGARRWLPVEPEMWSPKRAFGSWMRRVDSDAPLWTNHHGRPASAAVLARWMSRKVAPATGVEAGMYRFRHTRAVALHRAGLDVVYIKGYLGHRKLETTWNYLRRLGLDLDDAFRGINLPGIHSAVR